jgi:hypothetical protein
LVLNAGRGRLFSFSACLLAALGLAAGASACDGITPGSAFDRPMFTIDADFIPNTVLPAAAHPIVGVLWTDPLQRRPDVVMPAGWSSSSDIDPASGTLTFQADLFRPPPPEAVVDLRAASGDDTSLAFGELVVVDDADGDGTFGVSGPHAEIAPPDSYLAGTTSVLVYVARPFAEVESAFPLAGTNAGYQTVNFECNGQLSQETAIESSAEFVLQPSLTLPEIRNCRRTHSP